MMPILKWPGGKRKLAPLIEEAFGGPCKEWYIEPFLGSAAVYLYRRSIGSIQSNRSILSDANWRLVHFYRELSEEPSHLWYQFQKIVSSEKRDENGRISESFYRELVKQYNEWYQSPDYEDSKMEAIFLWLNKNCFNGLYRENAKGDFNVPRGDRRETGITLDQILSLSEQFQGTSLIEGLYQDARPHKGYQVYCDPPYLPVKTNSFTSYFSKEFGVAEHLKLAAYAIEAADRGAKVVISNSDTELTHTIYNEKLGFKVFHRMDVQRSIAASATARTSAGEVILTIG